MGGLYEVVTWLVYASAAIMMLGAIVCTILVGLALGFVAEFLREIAQGRQEGDTQHAEDGPRTPGQAKGSR